MSGISVLKQGLANPAWAMTAAALKARSGIPEEAAIGRNLLDKMQRVKLTPEEAFILQRNLQARPAPQSDMSKMMQERLPGFAGGGLIRSLMARAAYDAARALPGEVPRSTELSELLQRLRGQTIPDDTLLKIERSYTQGPDWQAIEGFRTPPEQRKLFAHGGLAQMRECRCRG